MNFIYPYVRQFLSRMHDWLPLFIYLKEKRNVGMYIFPPCVISVHMYRPWLFMVRAYLIRMMEEREEEKTQGILCYIQ